MCPPFQYLPVDGTSLRTCLSTHTCAHPHMHATSFGCIYKYIQTHTQKDVAGYEPIDLQVGTHTKDGQIWTFRQTDEW